MEFPDSVLSTERADGKRWSPVFFKVKESEGVRIRISIRVWS